MTVLWYLGCILIGYLLGNCNTAAIIARIKGFDIRTKGSGNAGASNALVTMGKGAAVLSALTDIFKAFIPVALLLYVLPMPAECASLLPVVTGIAVICGHIFPFWMGFRGGKGYASLLGMILALDWRFFLVCIALLGIVLALTRFIAISTMLTAFVLAGYWFVRFGPIPASFLLTALAVLILIKHLPNIRRIRSGEEIPLGKKKSPAPQESDNEKS